MLKTLICTLLLSGLSSNALAQSSPVPPKFRKSPSAIPGHYLVRLVDRAPTALAGLATSLAATYGGTVTRLYPQALGGFALSMPEAGAARLALDPRVEYVEADYELHQGVSHNSGRHGAGGGLYYLDRIDGAMDGMYSYCATGNGVYAYLLDSGIDRDATWCNAYGCYRHFFTGQVEPGRDFIGFNSADMPCTGPGQENGWHGTAVAGVLAGGIYGVAGDTTLIPVRVANCSGLASFSTVMAGAEWILQHDSEHFDTVTQTYTKRPAIVNISRWETPQQYYYGFYSSMEYMADALIDRGLTVIASANNFPEQNACDRAPANLGRYGPGAVGTDKFGNQTPLPARVITVGGTMIGDNLPNGSSTGDYRWQEYSCGPAGCTEDLSQDSGSTWGQCVSVWAPAKDISVAHHVETSFSASGTSFSAPQIAGIAARYLQTNKTATPDDVWNFVNGKATGLVLDITPPTFPVGGTKLVEWYEYCRTRPVSR